MTTTLLRSITGAMALTLCTWSSPASAQSAPPATLPPAVDDGRTVSRPRPDTVSAARPVSPWRGVFRIGAEYGGDEVLTFEYEDGSTPSVTAGGGLLLSAGSSYRALTRNGHALELQGQLGFKWRTIPQANNQDANWIRFPLEVLAFYRAPSNVRVGAGLTAHLRNQLKASGDVANGTVTFGNAPGVVLQAEYVRRDFAFDLRYTQLTYSINGGGSGTVGASSIGGGMSFFFPTIKRAK